MALYGQFNQTGLPRTPKFTYRQVEHLVQETQRAISLISILDRLGRFIDAYCWIRTDLEAPARRRHTTPVTPTNTR